jgi:hypothetical protein
MKATPKGKGRATVKSAGGLNRSLNAVGVESPYTPSRLPFVADSLLYEGRLRAHL